MLTALLIAYACSFAFMVYTIITAPEYDENEMPVIKPQVV